MPEQTNKEMHSHRQPDHLEQETSKNTPAKHYEKYIKWVDGMPVPAAREILRKEVFEILPITVLSLLYEPTFTDLENGDGERFIGMTNGEVMLVRMAESAAQGDKDAFKIILDRVLGKPKQFTEVKKMTMTYQDYLEQVTKNESQTIDAEVAQEREPNEFDL